MQTDSYNIGKYTFTNIFNIMRYRTYKYFQYIDFMTTYNSDSIFVWEKAALIAPELDN